LVFIVNIVNINELHCNYYQSLLILNKAEEELAN